MTLFRTDRTRRAPLSQDSVKQSDTH